MKTADTLSLTPSQAVDTLCQQPLQDTLCQQPLQDTLYHQLLQDALCQQEPQNTIVEDLISFDDCSYFAADTLFHPELPYRPFGFTATSTPYQLRYDGWNGLALLLCLLFAANIVLRLRKKFRELLRGIFFPIPGKMDEPLVDDPLRYSTRLVAVCLLSLTAAMVTFVYTQHDVEYYPFAETPYILFVAFFVLWLAYFLMKRLAGNFVNWIFFKREKIFTYQRAYTFFYAIGSLLSLVLAVVVMYMPFSPGEVLLMMLCLIFLVKILLLFKTYQLFFPKLYGTLHLIVYFCTLELMPLLVLVQFLAYAGWLSMVKL